MAEASERPGPSELEWVGGGGTDLSRIIGLSDGVFGFAMTFLVISLALPTLAASGGTHPPLAKYLAQLEPGVIDYLLAFMVVSGWWTIHHQLFSALRRYDPLLIRWNNLFLLLISLTPFTLAIVFQYGPQSPFDTAWSVKEAVAIFAAVEVLAGVLLLAIWRHATQDHRLVDPGLSPLWVKESERASQLRIGWFAASLAVALVLPFFAQLIWLGPMIGGRRRRQKVVRSARERGAPLTSVQP